MNADDSPLAAYRRGCQLLDLKRFADAEAVFRGLLAREPQDDWALHQLAFALWRQDRLEEALSVIRSAIGAGPEESAHQVLCCHVLMSLRRAGEALAAADEGVRLDPSSANAFAARAQALSGQSDWAGSEAAAREGLARDPDNALANHFLAHSLRQQGRVHENAAAVQEQLRRDPDSPLAHANAGWAALERGDRRKAEDHFATALRLAPDFEWAREGLLHAFRARSPLYRAYLAYSLWMSKRRAGQQWVVLIGLWLGARFARVLLTGNLRWLGLGLSLGYVGFAFWVWVARGIGNLLLFLDPFARMVLRRYEKLEAVFVGGGVLAGVGAVVAGFALPNDRLLIAGMAWVFGALPLACTFDNTRRIGRWLFGAIGAVAWLAALTAISALLLPAAAAEAAVTVAGDALPLAILGGVVTTWLGNLNRLCERH